jgi:hypothetical protein
VKIPSKEELAQDADIISRCYLALTDRGIKPTEAQYMAMIYLAYCKNEGKQEPWK